MLSIGIRSEYIVCHIDSYHRCSHRFSSSNYEKLLDDLSSTKPRVNFDLRTFVVQFAFICFALKPPNNFVCQITWKVQTKRKCTDSSRDSNLKIVSHFIATHSNPCSNFCILNFFMSSNSSKKLKQGEF